MMRLSTRLAYDEASLDETVRRATEAEQAGLDMVWVGEPYGFDAPTLLGYLAAKTRTVQIGAGVLPVFSRTPALTAMTAVGLDRVSGGRAILGLGASGPQVVEGWHGVPYRQPIARTRETIEICRKIWQRKPLQHHGAVYRIPYDGEDGLGLGRSLKLVGQPVRDAVPIFVAAIGLANVRMTAEHADGWLPIMYSPERADAMWGEVLGEGTQRRSSQLAPLEICAGGPVAIGTDVTDLLDTMRPFVALYVGGMGARGKNFYNDLMIRYGYEQQAAAIQEHYLAGRRRDAESAIPIEFLREISLVGDRGYVRERVQAYRESGVTILDVAPLGPDVVRTFGEIRELM